MAESPPELQQSASTDGLLLAEVAGTATDLSPAPASPRARVPHVCTEPAQIIGVQPDAPLAWSPDGSRLAFPSGNRSIYVASFRDNGSIGVDMALPGHAGLIRCLSFNPEAPHVLVSGGQDGLFVWDVRSGERLLCFPTGRDSNHESDVSTLCWAYGGSTLVTGSKDDKIQIRDAMDQYRLLETVHGHKASVCAVAFNEARHKLVSAGRDSTIKVYSAETLHPSWRERRREDSAIVVELEENMDGHMGDVVALTMSADGLMLFSGARDNSMKVWDMVAMRELRTVVGHTGDVKDMTLLADDSQLLSCALDGTVKRWRLLPRASAVEGRTDSQLIDDFLRSTVDADGNSTATVHVATERDTVLMSMRAHEQDCFAMVYNAARGVLATSSSMHEVKIFRVPAEGEGASATEPFELIHDFVGHTEAVTSVTLVADGERLLSSSLDYSIHLYNVATVRRMARFACDGSVLTHCVSPSEKFVYAAGADYDISVFRTEENSGSLDDQGDDEGRPVASLEGHSGRVQTLAISPDGSLLASGAKDFNIALWALPGGGDGFDPLDDETAVLSPRHRVEAHDGHVMGLDFSAHAGQLLLASVGNDHAVRVFSVRRGRLSALWHARDAHSSAVTSCVWGRGPSEDALFTGGWDSQIKVWDAVARRSGEGNCVATLTAHTARVTELSTSNDGHFLFSVAADFNCIQWQATTPFAPLCLFPGRAQDGVAMCVGVGPTTVVTGHESGMIKLWPQFDRGDAPQLFREAGDVLGDVSGDASLPLSGSAGLGAPVGLAASGGDEVAEGTLLELPEIPHHAAAGADEGADEGAEEGAEEGKGE